MATTVQTLPTWVPAFLKELVRLGDLTAAATAASVSRSAVYSLRKRSETFRDYLDRAHRSHADLMRSEAESAVDSWRKT